jgi:hypothetical protein
MADSAVKVTLDSDSSTGSLRSHSLVSVPAAPIWPSLAGLDHRPVPLLLPVLSLLLLLGFGSSPNMWVTRVMWAISTSSSSSRHRRPSAAPRTRRAGYEHRASWAWALPHRTHLNSPDSPKSVHSSRAASASASCRSDQYSSSRPHHLRPPPRVFTTQAEQSIASDAFHHRSETSVKCSPEPAAARRPDFRLCRYERQGKDH